MGIRILINTQPLETRVAVLEDGVLTDFELEREQKLVGAIYKGRVVNIVPGLEAAFVDVGLPRNAFIHLTEASTVPPGLPADGPRPSRRRTGRSGLAVGQEVVVQVARPPVGSKGARVTTQLTLQGRYCVLVVHKPGRGGVSRQIEDRPARKRLRKLAHQLRPLDHGLVLRTNAARCTEGELREDVRALEATWRDLAERIATTSAPALLHRELGLACRTVRDRLADEVEEIVFDAPEEYERCRKAVGNLAPELVSRLRLRPPPPPLFDAENVEEQIRQALARRVPLPSGGRITIDETEALTTIDVDSARFVTASDLATTALQTNLEAVSECARQIRLRDLGGIIVIDFLDMDHARDRIRVMDALQAELERDRMHPRIVSLSPLGLVELTRQRRGRSLSSLMRVHCPYCAGLGEVCSASTVAAEARRELYRRCTDGNQEAALVSVHPEVAAALVGDHGEVLEDLEKETGVRVFVTASLSAHAEQLDIETGPLADLAARHPTPAVGDLVEIRSADDSLAPHGNPLYAAHSDVLIRLPDLPAKVSYPLTLRITQIGPWFCRAETTGVS